MVSTDANNYNIDGNTRNVLYIYLLQASHLFTLPTEGGTEGQTDKQLPILYIYRLDRALGECRPP